MTLRTLNWSGIVRYVLIATLVACMVGSSALVGAFATDVTSDDTTADSRTNAQPIETGETIRTDLSSSDDVDWYAVNVTAGGAVVPHLYLLNESEGRSLEIELYGPNGEPVAEQQEDSLGGPESVAGDGSSDAHAVAPNVAETNTTYYVKIQTSQWHEATDNRSSPYNLTVQTATLDQYEPNENGSTAIPLTPAGSVNAVAAPYDHDVYAVDLVGGQNYTVALNYTENTSSTSYDRFPKEATLFADAANATDTPQPEGGTGLLTSYGGNQSVTFSVKQSGTYYLHLGQADANSEMLDQDDYRLTLIPTDDGTGGNDREESNESDGSDDNTDTPDRTDGDEGEDGTESPADDGRTGTDDESRDCEIGE